MNEKRRLLLKLLLIAIMVLQPVGAVFSMSMMNHHMGAMTAMAPSSNMMNHGDMHHATESAHPADLNADPDDCCASSSACSMASCGAVLFMNTISLPTVEMASIYFSSDHSWAGISLPTDIRPPRSHLG